MATKLQPLLFKMYYFTNLNKFTNLNNFTNLNKFTNLNNLLQLLVQGYSD